MRRISSYHPSAATSPLGVTWTAGTVQQMSLVFLWLLLPLPRMEKIVGHLFRISSCHGTKITKLENPSCAIWVFDEAVGSFPM